MLNNPVYESEIIYEWILCQRYRKRNPSRDKGTIYLCGFPILMVFSFITHACRMNRDYIRSQQWLFAKIKG